VHKNNYIAINNTYIPKENEGRKKSGINKKE
jgi:hypothetical protein